MEIENLLADLIKIQSVNPPGGETEVAKHLKHHRKITPTKKPILSLERMGNYDSEYNFGNPATI